MTENISSPEASVASHSATAAYRRLWQRLAFYYLVFFLFFGLSRLSLPETEKTQALYLALITAWLGALVGILLIEAALPVVENLGKSAQNQVRLLIRLILLGAMLDLAFNRMGVLLETGGTPGDFGRELTVAALKATGNLGLLTAALGAGVWVARGLLKPNYLVMAAIVGAITDIFSVYAGPTKHIVGSGAFPYLSFHWGVFVGSSRVDLQACKLEYSIVSPK